jgi:hypothetical protein
MQRPMIEERQVGRERTLRPDLRLGAGCHVHD